MAKTSASIATRSCEHLADSLPQCENVLRCIFEVLRRLEMHKSLQETGLTYDQAGAATARKKKKKKMKIQKIKGKQHKTQKHHKAGLP